MINAFQIVMDQPNTQCKQATNVLKRGKNIMWTKDMDKMLLECLCQVAEGNKIPHKFKEPAYTIAVNLLNDEFTLVCPLNKQHVQNRLKTLKVQFKAIHEVVYKSGFGWDSVNKKITVMDDSVWNTFTTVS